MKLPCALLVLAACGGTEETRTTTTTTTVVAPTVVPDAPPAPDAPVFALAPDAPPPPPRAATLHMAFTGDINMGGYYENRYDAQEVEKHDPLVELDAALISDLTIGNLETTVTRTLDVNAGGEHRFVTNPERVAILPRHHIATVTLANNHQFDNGALGLLETPPILTELGIAFVGAARADGPPILAETVEANGWRVAIIPVTTKLNRTPAAGARPAIAFADPKTLVADVTPVITAARADHDLVLVEIHWGTQYAEAPEPWQVTAAHAFVDAGADAVIGHHPHVLQAIERYRAGVIAYSLGNFLFPNAQEPTRQTGVLHLTFGDHCASAIAFDPAVAIRTPITHPIPAAGKDFSTVRDRFFRISAAAGTTWRGDGSRFVTDPTCEP